MRFDRPGTPLFLQLKLVHQMVRGNASEAKKGHFQPPFYRMHLRARLVSDQHQSLLSLEQAGNDVFYVAPAFHTIMELNTTYAERRVWSHSFRISPTLIGPLLYDKVHHVTFQHPTGPGRVYSDEPSKEVRPPGTEEIAASMQKRIFEAESGI